MSKLSTYDIVLGLVIWALGGITILTLTAIGEQKRRRGKLFSHLWEDIQESPIPALVGYSLMFIFSWISFIMYLLSETRKG